MTEFAIGDVVRLKSGGPAMTVVGEAANLDGLVFKSPGEVWALNWFEGEGMHVGYFPPEVLVLVDTAAPSEDIVVTEAMAEAGWRAHDHEPYVRPGFVDAIYRAMEIERRRGDK